MSKQSNQRFRKEMDKKSYKDTNNKTDNSHILHQKQSGHGNFNASVEKSNKTK